MVRHLGFRNIRTMCESGSLQVPSSSGVHTSVPLCGLLQGGRHKVSTLASFIPLITTKGCWLNATFCDSTST